MSTGPKIGMSTTNTRLWRGRPVARWHSMIKTAGPVCNIACKYCYYLSKLELLKTDTRWRMTDATLENIIRQHIEGHNSPEIVFSWQGGEPTLLGLDFFKRIIELQKKYTPPHKRCENDLQTNGTLLDDDWCVFLRENNFLVGLSIDGPAKFHDHYRVTNSGQGTHEKVFAAAKLLKKHGVPFATLTCVNRLTAQHPLEVYRFLRDEVGSTRMQFIPIVEPKNFRNTAPQFWPLDQLPLVGSSASLPGTPDSIVEDWCCDPNDFGDFLCQIFDELIARDLGKIHVHYFEAAIETWMGRLSPLCTHGPMCGKGIAIEHNGDTYACDHYVYPEYKIGNVNEVPLAGMAFSQQQEHFGTNKERSLTAYCRACRWQFACYGECPKNRFLRAPDGEPGLNYLCPGWKKFYAHIDPTIQRIVRQLGHTPVTQTPADRPPTQSALGPQSP